MAIYAAAGNYNAILGVVSNTPSLAAVLTVTPKFVAVVGSVYVASTTGGSTTIASSDGTIAVTGSTTNYDIKIAQQGATLNQVLAWNGTKFAPASGAGTGTVTSVTVGTSLSTGLIFATSTSTPVLNAQNVGATPTTVFLRGDGTWASPPSGGGGGTFTSTSIWTGGASNKNAYLSPGNINNVGITINLVASSGAGGITAAVVSLNGVSLPNSYASTGAWPNLVITIPVADITGNAAQIANTVAVSLTGTFGGSGTNIANAGMLTNTQPTLFTTTLTGSYAVASVPFYTTTATLNWTYGNTTGTILAFGGTFTPGGPANTLTGSFAGIAITGSTIGGVAIGNGLAGAGSRTINLTGSVAGVPTFTPAFYVQTANATVPTFTTASTQTPGSQINATITYPVATATTQYNWVATTQAVGKVMFVSPFGNSPIVPDVTSSAVIGGLTFNIFGLTALTVGSAASLLITA